MLDPTLKAADYDLARIEEEIREGLPVSEYELADIATHLLGYIADLVKLEVIDSEMRSETDRDFEALGVVVQALREEPVVSLSSKIGARTLSMRELVTAMAAKLAEIALWRDPVRISFSIDFLDMRLTNALICILENEQPIPASLTALAHSKVTRISDREVPQLWALIKGDFRGERINRFPADSPILPEGFLETSSLAQMRERIVDYLLWIKPRLIVESVRRGQEAVPGDTLKLTQLLSARFTVARPQFLHRHLLRSLAKLVLFWEDRNDELLDAMHLGAQSWVAWWASQERAMGIVKIPTDNRDRNRMRLGLLRRASVYADAYSVGSSPLGEALAGYRLGLEVAVQDIRGVERQKPEVRLQRDLARFLLERGHFAVGTKFGRSETDLLVAEGGDVVVIEAKKYSRPPTETSVCSALAQLQVYVSQQKIPSSRGVLMVFNFSPRFIVAPRRWIRHQFYVLPVNLGPLSPSETRETLTVEEAPGDRLINAYLNGPKGRTSRSAPGGPAGRGPLGAHAPR